MFFFFGNIQKFCCSAQVGLLDIDICGPSVPKMMGLEGQEIHQSANGWSPVYVDTQDGTLGVMSIGEVLQLVCHQLQSTDEYFLG